MNEIIIYGVIGMLACIIYLCSIKWSVELFAHIQVNKVGS